jgi:hypothetical protein
MPKILNQELYDKVKSYADTVYAKPSAYKSGFIVKKYKELGGKYGEDKKPKKLKQWFKEEWGDIGNKEYPVYRPFKRVNKTTPLTKDEIDPKQAKEQIELKQEIKGEANLPPFTGKGIDNMKDVLEIPNIPKSNEIWQWSNPTTVRKKADKYLGKDVPIYLSTKKNKKYMVEDPDGKLIHFGQLKYEDHTKHLNDIRRKNYLTRTSNIRGNWKSNKYSPNSLSRNLLW